MPYTIKLSYYTSLLSLYTNMICLVWQITIEHQHTLRNGRTIQARHNELFMLSLIAYIITMSYSFGFSSSAQDSSEEEVTDLGRLFLKQCLQLGNEKVVSRPLISIRRKVRTTRMAIPLLLVSMSICPILTIPKEWQQRFFTSDDEVTTCSSLYEGWTSRLLTSKSDKGGIMAHASE